MQAGPHNKLLITPIYVRMSRPTAFQHFPPRAGMDWIHWITTQQRQLCGARPTPSSVVYTSTRDELRDTTQIRFATRQLGSMLHCKSGA
ncbi:hypothetical protein VTH82DRAFT_3218 [Thermothelomyces myriococcoides]